jgi:hypothetical protein
VPIGASRHRQARCLLVLVHAAGHDRILVAGRAVRVAVKGALTAICVIAAAGFVLWGLGQACDSHEKSDRWILHGLSESLDNRMAASALQENLRRLYPEAGPEVRWCSNRSDGKRICTVSVIGRGGMRSELPCYSIGTKEKEPVDKKYERDLSDVLTLPELCNAGE